jgi:GMP synthase-like glutamine amidotransferase
VRALAIVHQPDAGPGVFVDAMRSRNVDLDEWLIPAGPAPAEPTGYDAVLTFGGAMHADHEADHPWLRDEKSLLGELIGRGVPVLGMCLGCQLLAEAAGAPARRSSAPEIGWHEVELTAEAADDPLLGGLPGSFEAFQWHSYEAPLPPGATALARSAVCLQAYRLDGPAWGIQFHAEVTHDQIAGWIAEGRDIPGDRDALAAATEERIEGWNELGRTLCDGFLTAAERAQARAA